jgi:hypothetical protein
VTAARCREGRLKVLAPESVVHKRVV